MTYTVRDENGAPLGRFIDKRDAVNCKRFYLSNGFRNLRIQVTK